MPNIPITSVTNALQPHNVKAASSPSEAQKNFASFLKDSIDKVNETQVKSDMMAQKLARGENMELHEVMIASQMASITLTATMEIRNKVIEAYQEVMRMQV